MRSLTEMTRPAPSQKMNLWKLVRGLRRLDDLKVRSMLAGPGWEFAGTILSRKLFVYSPVGQGGLLKEYRLHPTSPVKKVKTDEAVALYDTATTFISREGGKEMVVMTEFPDGHWIQSVASSLGFQKGDVGGTGDAADGKTPFEFTVYAKRSGKGVDPTLPQSDLAASRERRKSGEKASVMGSVPRRSKFVQFGKDNTSEDQRFGARETYSYIMGGRDVTNSQRISSAVRETFSNVKDRLGLMDFADSGNQDGVDPSRTCTVRYTRYGEAPPWYGPGKMCTLEVWGKRVESVADAPALAATLAATRIPGFLSVHTSIPAGPGDDDSADKRRNASLGEKQVKEQMAADQAAIQAVRWFRGKEGSLPLEVLKNNDEIEQSFMSTVVDTGLSIAQRVRAASTSTSAAER